MVSSRCGSGTFPCAHGVVRQVTHRFRHGAEGGRQLNPSHSACHGNADQLRLPRMPRQNDAEPQAVLGPQEHSVEPVLLNVVFARAHWAKPRVGMPDFAQDPLQGMSELHGLRWRMRFRHFVDGRPPKVPGMVA